MSGGANAGDLVSYRESNAGVQVSLTFGDVTTGAGGHAQGEKIRGFLNITGSQHDDRLADTVLLEVGSGGNANVFEGGNGNDQLRLGGGRDVGRGGAGNDSIWGQQGVDRLLGGTGNDRLDGGTEADTLEGNAGDDNLFGAAGADSVVSNEGNDDLYGGGDWNDTLIGGRGADWLFGGAGSDDFLFLAGNEGTDRIFEWGGSDGVGLDFAGLTLRWDRSGAIDKGGARLVRVGADTELHVNTDTNTGIEFRLVFVARTSVSELQIGL